MRMSYAGGNRFIVRIPKECLRDGGRINPWYFQPSWVLVEELVCDYIIRTNRFGGEHHRTRASLTDGHIFISDNRGGYGRKKHFDVKYTRLLIDNEGEYIKLHTSRQQLRALRDGFYVIVFRGGRFFKLQAETVRDLIQNMCVGGLVL